MMIFLQYSFVSRVSAVVAIVMLLLSSPVGQTSPYEEYQPSSQFYANQRVQQWRQVQSAALQESLAIKLKKVNLFFNQLAFIDDAELWDAADYWATPVELLSKGAGDCEDFAIAKYFTLVAMGVDKGKLRITYANSLVLGQAHMVLLYHPSEMGDALVLDNTVDEILPTSERPDLDLMYGFNSSDLWVNGAGGGSYLAGSSTDIIKWKRIQDRHQQSLRTL